MTLGRVMFPSAARPTDSRRAFISYHGVIEYPPTECLLNRPFLFREPSLFPMRDIATDIGLDKVKAVIGDFYDRVQEHPALARPFGIVDDWREHKAHLSHFW